MYSESVDSRLVNVDDRTTAGDQVSPLANNERYLESLAKSRESQQKHAESRYHSIDRHNNGSSLVAKS